MDNKGKKILVIVDMQNDFIDGVLGNDMTKAVLPKVVKKLKECGKDYTSIYLTRDIHFDNYMDTLEGKKLPVPHCLKEGSGKNISKDLWDVVKELRNQKKFVKVVDKHTFASHELVDYLSVTCGTNDEIEFWGVCTDICVVSNAICTRMALPNTVIKVNANCCAGTSLKAHNAALRTMASCQIDIIGRQYGKKSDTELITSISTENYDDDCVTEANN